MKTFATIENDMQSLRDALLEIIVFCPVIYGKLPKNFDMNVNLENKRYTVNNFN